MRKIQFFIILVLFTTMGLIRGSNQLTLGIDDLVLHFTGYIIFLISARFAYNRHLAIILFLLFLYSIGIELIQYYLPYRTFSLIDILANLLGLCAGVIIWKFAERFKPGPVIEDSKNGT